MSHNCSRCLRPVADGAMYCDNCGALQGDAGVDPIRTTASNLKCPACGRTYDGHTRFCIVDGARLVSTDGAVPSCPTCGTEYPGGEKYCIKDGTRIVGDARYEEIFREGTYNYAKAPLGKRFGSSLLDTLFTSLLSIPSTYCLYQGLLHRYREEASSWYMVAFIFYLAPLYYSLIKEGLAMGQSLGKRATDLMVVDLETNLACTKGKSFVRNLVSSAIVMVPYIVYFRTQSPIAGVFFFAVAMIEPVMVLAREDGRKIGDLAANTQVIEIQNYRSI